MTLLAPIRRSVRLGTVMLGAMNLWAATPRALTRSPVMRGPLTQSALIPQLWIRGLRPVGGTSTTTRTAMCAT